MTEDDANKFGWRGKTVKFRRFVIMVEFANVCNQ